MNMKIKKYSEPVGGTMNKQIITVILGVSWLLSPLTALADDEQDLSHFYMGFSTGYYTPSKTRGVGNTRTTGLNLGYQINQDWSAEYQYHFDFGSPGNTDFKAQRLNLVRHWGGDTRFLVNLGLMDVNFDGMSSTMGYNIGAGISAFLTERIELRGDLNLVYFPTDGTSEILSDRNDDAYLEGVGTVSLNYHFGRESAIYSPSTKPLLGSSGDQSLPPMQHREPIQTQQPAQQQSTYQQPVQQPYQQAPAMTEEPAVVQQPAQPSREFAQPETAPAKSSSGAILFDADSINLDSSYNSELDQISNKITSTNSRAVVEGHSDNQGSEVQNRIISTDRAIVVKRELKKRGVPGEDLRVIGHGADRPVATNETEEGRAQNRRVEVKLYDKE